MSDLSEDDYVYTDLGIERVHYCEVSGEKEMVTPKGFILGDVPDFKQWNWIKLDNIRVNMELTKVKQQLAIAVEALETYADERTWYCCFKNECAYVDGFEANEALIKIKELEK